MVNSDMTRGKAIYNHYFSHYVHMLCCQNINAQNTTGVLTYDIYVLLLLYNLKNSEF